MKPDHSHRDQEAEPASRLPKEITGDGFPSEKDVSTPPPGSDQDARAPEDKDRPVSKKAPADGSK